MSQRMIPESQLLRFYSSALAITLVASEPIEQVCKDPHHDPCRCCSFWYCCCYCGWYCYFVIVVGIFVVVIVFLLIFSFFSKQVVSKINAEINAYSIKISSVQREDTGERLWGLVWLLYFILFYFILFHFILFYFISFLQHMHAMFTFTSRLYRNQMI